MEMGLALRRDCDGRHYCRPVCLQTVRAILLYGIEMLHNPSPAVIDREDLKIGSHLKIGVLATQQARLIIARSYLLKISLEA